MILGVFSVYDKKSKSFSQPILCDSHPGEKEEVAKRLFVGMFRPESMLYDFAEDYDLIYLGTYNDTTGLFYSDPATEPVERIPIMTGIEAKSAVEERNKYV